MNTNKRESSCAVKMLFVPMIFILLTLALSARASAMRISGADVTEGQYYACGTDGGLVGSDSEGWTVLLLGDTLYLKGAEMNDILLDNGENITIRLLADSKIGNGKGIAVDYAGRGSVTSHITLDCGEYTLTVDGDCSTALTAKSGNTEIKGTLYCLSTRSGRHGDIIIDGGSLAVEGAVELGLPPTDGSYPGNVILLNGAFEALDGLSREPIIIPQFIYQTEPGGDYSITGYKFSPGEYISIIIADFAEPIRDDNSGDDFMQNESEPDTRSTADNAQSTAEADSSAAESPAAREEQTSRTSGIAVAALIVASAALALGIILAAAGVRRKKAAQKHGK